MASIRTRARKNLPPQYSVLWRDTETGRQTSMPFSTRQEAERFQRLIEHNGNRIGPAVAILHEVARKSPTIAATVVEHINGQPSINERTRKDYLRDCERYIAGSALGPVHIDNLQPTHIKAWLHGLASGELSDKSIANLHGLLSSAITSAVAAGLRADNPCRGIRLPRRSEHEQVEMTFLTKAEWRILEGEIGKRLGGYYLLLFQALMGTGMRWGEACALQVADLDFDADPPTIRISRALKRDENNRPYIGPTKTRRSRRSVSIQGALAADLLEHVKGRPGSDLVFKSRTGGTLHHSNIRSRVWVPAIAAAQNVDVYGAAALRDTPRIHDLRHSHASWLLASGLDLLTVQRRLGHESITTTADRYGHALPGQQKAAADVIAALMG